MDTGTKQMLEDARTRVPRYLFRAWNNTPVSSGLGRLSGGYEGLNTPDAVTPLAFSNGRGHDSVYDMDKAAFTAMAIAHLTGQSTPETELSSWAGSLSFALNSVAYAQLGGTHDDGALDSVYIGIVDTKELWNDVEVFYVPHLDFLQPGAMSYPHEYLAHGVVQGYAYKAMPLRIFHDVLTPGAAGGMIRIDDGQSCKEIVSESLKKARTIADQYGGDFVLPMSLAVLCRKKRDPRLFREGVHKQQFEVIMDGFSDLTIPQKWHNDYVLQRDEEITNGYGDVEQLCRLMYALLTGFVKESADEDESYADEQTNQEQQSSAGNELAEEEHIKQESQKAEDDIVKEEAPETRKGTKRYANAAQARAAARVSAKRHKDRMEANEQELLSDASKPRGAKEKAKRLLRSVK